MSSSRGSSDEDFDTPAVDNLELKSREGLEILVGQGICAASTLVSWLVRKRGWSTADWRMTEEEGRRVAGPIVRIASRRIQLRSISGDALDAGAEANFLTSYVTRVLGGSGPEGGPPAAQQRSDLHEAEQQRQRAAWEAAEQQRRAAEMARASAAAAAQGAESRASAAGTARGDDQPTPTGSLDVFTGMEEAGLG